VPFRERTYRTEAIVLRRKDIGEADRILTLLTPGQGKVRVIAKGIRKPRSRKAGHLELFTRAKLLLARGHDLDIVTQAELVEAYRPVREDLLRSAYAGYMVELLDRFTPDEQENPELYELLTHGLAWAATAANLALAARAYELHLLSAAGFQPQLYRCVSCRKELLPEDQFFSPHDGGVICAACGAPPEGPYDPRARAGWLPLSLNALKLLRFTQSNPYAKVAALTISPRTAAEVETLMARYITILLERQLKSVEFLKLIRRADSAVEYSGAGAPSGSVVP
jgi:DNA repair protein RecO (recombination protein O)